MNAERLKTAEELLAEAEESLKNVTIDNARPIPPTKRFGTPVSELDDPKRVKGKFVYLDLYDQKRKRIVKREGHVKEVLDKSESGVLCERRVVIAIHNGHATNDTYVELDFFDRSWRFRFE